MWEVKELNCSHASANNTPAIIYFHAYYKYCITREWIVVGLKSWPQSKGVPLLRIEGTDERGGKNWARRFVERNVNVIKFVS